MYMPAQEKVKRKLTAILSADVKGYSILMADDEVHTIETLKSYRQIVSDFIQDHSGRVVDSPGDNILAEFRSAVDAVQCAVNVQKQLQHENERFVEDKRIQFRIGVNVGDVIQDGVRIYGHGVNVAARIEGLAEPSGVCISRNAYDHIRDKLDLGYEYLGEHSVKNIKRPVRVYKVLMDPEDARKLIGVKRTSSAKKWIWPLATAILILLGIVSWQFYQRKITHKFHRASTENMAHPLPDKPSIVVLPFTNLSDNIEQEYFADGMADDLITDLSKISGLFVIARNSAFTYKGKAVKIRKVAEELGVRYVLEGSVRRAENRVRINAQLIDATTDGHIWAERYDGELGDILALQDQITKKIVSALAVQLTVGEQAQFILDETDNPNAYDAFLQGWDHYKHRKPDSFAKAVPYFKKAVKLDPEYGRAYAALASTYWEIWERGWHNSIGLSRSETYDLAKQLLILAMERPTSLAHQVASEMYRQEREYDKAIDEAELAIAIDPNDGGNHVAKAGALIMAGRAIEAIDHVRTAMRLDPHYPAYYLYVLGVAQFGTEQFEKAAATLKRATKRNPENHAYLIPLTAAYGHIDNKQEAAATIDQYVELRGWSKKPSVDHILSGWPFKDIKDRDRLADGLLKAGLAEH